MARRSKVYYPASQIITGLYTQGKEWMLLDGTEYIGPYHRYADGLVMTLFSYDREKSDRLMPYSDLSIHRNSFVYDDLTEVGTDIKKHSSPKTYFPILEQEDYIRGYFERYFVQRRNSKSNMITEISETDFNTLATPNQGIHRELYKGTKLRWKISGPEFDTDRTTGVVDTNKRTLALKELELKGISRFLFDLREFSVYSEVTSNEFKNLVQ